MTRRYQTIWSARVAKCQMVAVSPPTSPWTTPLGCLVQVVTGASLQVLVPRVLLGCHAFAWCVGGSLQSLLRFHCGTKGTALCGVLTPSTPLWHDLVLLCAAAPRYSSLMFQVPHWTSAKAPQYPLWFLCAPSPPVCCCLPALLLLSWCVLSLCPCGSAPSVILSCGPLLPWPCSWLFGPSPSVVDCLTICFAASVSDPLPLSGIRSPPFGVPQSLRFSAASPPLLCLCPSCLSCFGGLLVFGGVLVGPFVLLFLWAAWVRG